MATGKTMVAYDDVMSVVRKHMTGLTLEDKKRWVKVQGPGGKLYIPKSKTVGTVRISNFTAKGPGIRELPPEERETEKVTQELDFRGVKQEDVLASLELLMGELAATVKPAKKEPEAKEAAPSAPEAPLPAESEEQGETVAA